MTVFLFFQMLKMMTLSMRKIRSRQTSKMHKPETMGRYGWVVVLVKVNLAGR